MKRPTLVTLLLSFAAWPALAQTEEAAPKFIAADVHASPKAANPNQAFPRSSPPQGGRYEIRNSTMVDLIRYAYGTDPDKVFGGPSWLEMDRFDVTAKLPPDTSADNRKLMLQALLKERFNLVTHPDSKPMTHHVLTVGKKPQLKQAEGTEESGCKPQQASGAPAEGGVRLSTMGPNGGAPITINLGAGMTVQYSCRNISMAGFVSGLRTMMFANLGPNPVIDETGLKGTWNFDLRFSVSLFGPMGNTGDRVPLPEAIEKQLGLKLEERQIPTPVMVVDSVNQKPTANAPGTAEALPPVAVPTEFEVATIKLATGDMRMSRYSMQPGGPDRKSVV